MGELTSFLRWLVEYAVSGGFWHFVAVFLIVRAITGITTFARLSIKREAYKPRKPAAGGTDNG